MEDRMTRLAVAVSLLFVVAGCGDDDSPNHPADAAGFVDSGGDTIDGALADGAPGPDAPPGPDGGINNTPDGSVGVACGDTAPCTTSQECCVTGAGGHVQFSCVPLGTCQGAAVACDGPEDCSGHPCCGTLNGPASGAACATGDTCEQSSFTLCHNSVDCPTPETGSPTCCPNPLTGQGGYCSPNGECF
jgi:hypothetical protein